MILADTSIWIDHFRSPIVALSDLVESDGLRMHPFVLAELSLSSLADRHNVLDDLRALTSVSVATDDEVAVLVERERLFGQDIGWVDAHLLASTLLTDNMRLWTKDRRLLATATRLRLAADL